MYSEFFKLVDRFGMVNPTLLLQFHLGKELKKRDNMLGSRTEVKTQKPVLNDVIYLRNYITVLIFVLSVQKARTFLDIFLCV